MSEHVGDITTSFLRLEAVAHCSCGWSGEEQLDELGACRELEEHFESVGASV